MPSEAKQTKKAAKQLHQMQAEQAQGARKLGRLRDKLEMRSRRFQKLEAEMAALEQQLYTAPVEGQPSPLNAKALRPALLVINSHSRGFDHLAESPENLVAVLQAHGIAAEVYVKTSGKALRTRVREAVKVGVPLVIAAGGDGTIGHVACELAGTDTVLGILPTGAMNNVAHELGIPLDLQQACALLGAGITRPIDLGWVGATDEDKGHYFLETAGVGLMIALPAGQNVKKGRWGKLPSAFRQLLALSDNPITIELDSGEVLETKVQLVTVSNAPLYAVSNLIAPEAKMDDGLLDVALYDGLSDSELAAYFLQTANGQRVANPNVRFYRARHVQIRAAQDLPVTADNVELPSRHVLDLEVAPRALTAIVGKGTGLAWPVEAVRSVPPLAGPQDKPKTELVPAPNGNGHVTAEFVPAAEAAQPEPVQMAAASEELRPA